MRGRCGVGTCRAHRELVSVRLVALHRQRRRLVERVEQVRVHRRPANRLVVVRHAQRVGRPRALVPARQHDTIRYDTMDYINEYPA